MANDSIVPGTPAQPLLLMPRLHSMVWPTTALCCLISAAISLSSAESEPHTVEKIQDVENALRRVQELEQLLERDLSVMLSTMQSHSNRTAASSASWWESYVLPVPATPALLEHISAIRGDLSLLLTSLNHTEAVVAEAKAGAITSEATLRRVRGAVEEEKAFDRIVDRKVGRSGVRRSA